MIDKKSRRVVIINNIQSDTIDQAIFILKSDKPGVSQQKFDNDVAKEAQDIIDNYINQVERLKKIQGTQHHSRHKSGRAKRLSFLLPVSLTAAFMLTVFFIAVYFG